MHYNRQSQFELFPGESGQPIEKADSRFFLTSLTLSLENLVVVGVVIIMGMVIAFSLGVERGKKGARLGTSPVLEASPGESLAAPAPVVKSTVPLIPTSAPVVKTTLVDTKTSTVKTAVMKTTPSALKPGTIPTPVVKTALPASKTNNLNTKAMPSVPANSKDAGPIIVPVSGGKTAARPVEVVVPVSSGLPSAAPETVAQEKKIDKGYTVQVASYAQTDSAERESIGLKKRGYETFILPKGKYFILCVGKFADKAEADIFLVKLKKQYKDCLVRSF
jgi:cell division septation protein DedD